MAFTKYNGDKLKKEFNELECFEDITLYPLFHVAAYEWIGQLPDQGITDLKQLDVPFACGREEYHLVLGGKLVQITIASCLDIPLSFSGDDGATTEIATNQFTNFIKSQGLAELVKKTGEQLKKDGSYFRDCPQKILDEASDLYPKGKVKKTMSLFSD